MKKRLLQGLDERGIQIAKENFAKGYHLREDLTRVLNEDIETCHRSMESENLFEFPNWELKQASKIAEVKVLRRIIGLLNEEK